MEYDENKRQCADCGEEIEEDAECYETDDGYICESCFIDNYFICDQCGKVKPVESMEYWGDSCICSDCLENECPAFDREENEKETAEAYKTALETYLGCKTKLSPGSHPLYYKFRYDDNTEYSVAVTIDEEHRISDLSRLTAQTLLWESETSSGWEDCAIEESDFDWILPKMLDEHLLDEDEIKEKQNETVLH